MIALNQKRIGSQFTAHAWWASAMACVLLSSSIWLYTVDDAFITYRYARNLAAGDGAVFNPGDPVEGFTSPLWLGVATVAETLTLPPEHACKVVSLAAVIGLLWYVSRRTRKLHAAAQLPLLLLATHVPLLVAIVCGLETATNTVLIACMLLSSHGEKVRGRGRKRELNTGYAIALWGSLAILCRPENGLLVGVHGLYLWSTRPKQRRALYFSGAMWLIIGAALTGARYAYYGSIVPNTATAKLAIGADLTHQAWHYCLTWFGQHHWLLLLGVPALLAKKHRTLAVNGWLLIAAQTGFVFLAGGDWMPQWRFLLPIVGVLSVLGCYSVDATITFARRFSLHNIEADEEVDIAMGTATIVACTAGIVLLAATQVWALRTERWALESYRQQLKSLETGPVRYLATHAESDDVIAARDVGVLGYRAHCRILDLVGLTDRHIAATSGLRRRDHIDLDYVFGESPTYLMLQSERDDETGEMSLGRLARRVAADVRFDSYRLCYRWEQPGGHFCEVYKLNARISMTETAMRDTDE